MWPPVLSSDSSPPSIKMNYYFASVHRTPSKIVKIPIRSYGGNSALKVVSEDHGKLFAVVASTIFPGAFRVMDRVQQNVLPEREGTDPMAFKAAFVADLNNLAVAAALIAQLSFGAWQLPLLSNVHWICKACSLCSLGFAVLSTFCAVNMSRNLNSFDVKEDFKDWLSRPCSRRDEEMFCQNLGRQYPQLSSAPHGTKLAAATQINNFIRAKKATRASFYSSLMLVLPSTLLHVAIGLFLLAVAIYLGVVYGHHLDSIESNAASRAVLICYILAISIALTFFYGSHNLKDFELHTLRTLARDIDKFERAHESSNTGANIELGHR